MKELIYLDGRKLIILLARKNRLVKNIVSFIGLLLLSKQNLNILRWKIVNGDETLRLDYSLNPESIVFDVGGFKGESSMNIYAKYNCNIYIFEPINEYYQFIKKRFQNYKKIHVLNVGLGAKTKYIEMHLLDDATSAFGKSASIEKVKLMNIKEVFRKYTIKNVDLIELNIEGGEYELLENIIKSNFVNRFKDIQVQFHQTIKNAGVRRANIQKALRKTHTLTFHYPFVWENWRRLDNSDEKR